MSPPEYEKVYARSGRHPAREEDLQRRSHMQERHTRSHADRPLKREYPEDYVDYDIGYAKRNDDFAYDWAKRNGKTLRKVIGILFVRQLCNHYVTAYAT